MGVEGCTKCIKYMLFVFNFIFWLAGGVILGVALWLRHEPTTSNLLIQQIGDKQVPATFYIGIYIIIAVGAVMMFVGFLGCYGAIQESQCLLGTFFACLVILFACEVAAGIWGFVNREQVSKEIKQFYDEAYEQARSPKKEEQEKARPVIKVFHESLQCCKFDIKNAVDNLCPSGIMNVNCHEKIDALFQSKLHLVGIAAAVVAVIMIIEMIFSMVLCCGIRIYSVY
ncbi:CD81 antigen [Hyla sarda]|uniref:CD81 antigen n=1 Tax=Hyla sarda TaxID=327740 RepID=UPI0024C212CD|nr:CD81 antigen [Hyla sarda]